MKLRITKAPTGETGIYEIGQKELMALNHEFLLAQRKGLKPFVRRAVSACRRYGFTAPAFDALDGCASARIKTLRLSPGVSEITLTWRVATKEAVK